MTRARQVIGILIALLCYFTFVVFSNIAEGTTWKLYISEFITIASVTFFGSALGFLVSSYLNNKDIDKHYIGPIEAHINYVEYLISSGQANIYIRENQFNQTFSSRLEDYGKSYHIAFLTPASLQHYSRPEVQDKWSSDDRVAERKRIVVVPDEANLRSSDDYEEVVRHFSQTASTRFVRGEDLSEDNVCLLKDCAVFLSNSNINDCEAFFSYSQRGSYDRFCKIASRHYSTKNSEFCQNIIKAFNDVWNDEDVKKAGVILERVLLPDK